MGPSLARAAHLGGLCCLTTRPTIWRTCWRGSTQPRFGPFERIIELTRAYFNATSVDFDDVECEMPGEGAFGGKVLLACRTIRYGQTTNYGGLAKLIGQPDASRAVAAALGKNAIPLVIPCHRVTYAGGDLGGFSAAGGVEVKRRMLALEAGQK